MGPVEGVRLETAGAATLKYTASLWNEPPSEVTRWTTTGSRPVGAKPGMVPVMVLSFHTLMDAATPPTLTTVLEPL